MVSLQGFVSQLRVLAVGKLLHSKHELILTKGLNMNYTPQAIITTPNTETIDTAYLDSWPQA